MARTRLSTLVGLFICLFIASVTFQLHLVDKYIPKVSLVNRMGGSGVLVKNTIGNHEEDAAVNRLRSYGPFDRIPQSIWINFEPLEEENIAKNALQRIWRGHEWKSPLWNGIPEDWDGLEDLSLLVKENANLEEVEPLVDAISVEDVLSLQTQLLDVVSAMKAERSELVRQNINIINRILPQSIRAKFSDENEVGEEPANGHTSLDISDEPLEGAFSASQEATVDENDPNCSELVPEIPSFTGDQPSFVIHPSVPKEQAQLWIRVLARKWKKLSFSNEVMNDPSLRLLVLPMTASNEPEAWLFAKLVTKSHPVLISRVPVGESDKASTTMDMGNDLFGWFTRRQHQLRFVQEYLQVHGCSTQSVSWIPTTFDAQKKPTQCMEMKARYKGKNIPFLAKSHGPDMAVHEWDLMSSGERGIRVYSNFEELQHRLGDCSTKANKKPVEQTITRENEQKFARMKSNPIVWGDHNELSVSDRNAFQIGDSDVPAKSMNNPFSNADVFYQESVLRPLLAHSRQIMVHSFVLVARTSPWLLGFHPGIVTLASSHARSVVEAENIGAAVTSESNLRKQTTNIHRQRAQGNDVDNSIWDFDRFLDYLEASRKCTREADDSDLTSCDIVKANLAKVALLSFQMASGEIQKSVGNGQFSIFQVSMWLDEEFTPVWRHTSPHPYLIFDESQVSRGLGSELLSASVIVAEYVQTARDTVERWDINEPMKIEGNESPWSLLYSQQLDRCHGTKPVNPCQNTRRVAHADASVHNKQELQKAVPTPTQPQSTKTHGDQVDARFGVRHGPGVVVEEDISKLSSPTIRLSLARREL